MKRFEIPFEEKNSEKFSRFLNTLYSKNQLPIYIWTEFSNDCGVYRISSILDFNSYFTFEVNADGLIHLLSENLDDELIFDFTEDNNERLLEIELSGANWIQVEY
ncbi:hypothetical protein [Leptospira sanjuanensis]|uniref:hypothetical protein n=1 Tax=Leptospira sanjuanensis TaxID=2879643 RepID=UPI0029E7CCE6|nr:hypothetical protein [Leptospira sanjuanensis]